MQTKVVEYGTTHTVTVQSADKKVIIVVADEINEAFVLLGHGLEDLPGKGDRGTITFKRGGPTGGHWEYAK